MSYRKLGIWTLRPQRKPHAAPKHYYSPRLFARRNSSFYTYFPGIYSMTARMPGRMAPKTRSPVVVASTVVIWPKLPPAAADADAAPCDANKLELILPWSDVAAAEIVASSVLN